MPGRVRLDTTRSSSIAVCNCGFRAASLTAAGALRLAKAHEAAAHPGDYQASNLLTLRRRRAAA